MALFGDPLGGPSEELGPIENVAKAALTGLRKDPFIGPAIDFLSERALGITEEQLNQIGEGLREGLLTDIPKFVGEFAPMVAGGLGAHLAGRAVVRAGATALGKRVSAQAAGKIATALKQQATLASQTAAKTGVSAFTTAKPGLVTGAEILAGSAAEGAFFGGQALVRTGGDRDAALREALTTGGIALGITGGAALAGRLFVGKLGGGRRLAEFPRSAEARKLREIPDDLIREATKLNAKISEITSQRTQLQSLLQGAGPLDDITNVTQKLRALPGAEDLIALKQQATGLESVAKNLLKEFSEPSAAANYFEKPFNPGALRTQTEIAKLHVMTTPEGILNKISTVTSINLKNTITNLEAITNLRTAAIATQVARSRNVIGQALGLKKSGSAKFNKQFLDALDALQTGGENGFLGFMQRLGRSTDDANRALGEFKKLSDLRTQILREFVDNGAIGPSIISESVRKSGVQFDWPTLFRNVNETKLRDGVIKALIKSGQASDEASALSIAGDIVESMKQNQAGLLSASVRDKLGAGSLKALKTQGFEIEDDIFAAMFRELNTLQHNEAVFRQFGWTRDVRQATIKGLKDANRLAGGSEELFNTAIDGVLGQTYYGGAMKKLADTVTSYQIGTKLVYAVLPNLSQTPLNTGLLFGLRRTGRGYIKALRNVDRREALKAAGLWDELGSGFGRAPSSVIALERPTLGIASADRLSQIIDDFSSGVLRGTGFTWAEKWNRAIGGSTALEFLRDSSLKIRHGLLKGQSLERVRRTARSFGVSIDDYVRLQDTLPVEELAKFERLAMYRGAQVSQFIPSTARKPLFWEHPMGRVIFQFKNFALGQTRFLRDRIALEAAQGNIAPLAYFLAFYPVAGEMVGGARRILSARESRESDGLERYIEDVLAVGGFGLATDIMTASKFGRLADFALGPMIGDAVALLEGILRGDLDSLGTWVTRQPAYRATRTLVGGGAFGAERIAEALDNAAILDTLSDTSLETVTFFDMKRSRPTTRE